MLHFIITAYITAQTVSLICSWPQLKRLYQIKNSDGFSLTTWSIWTMSTSVSMIYALANHQYLWFTINIFWILFHLTMVVMIIYFRRNRSSLRANLSTITPAVEPVLEKAIENEQSL